ncbi:phospholipase D-like domain-containing protein [Novosphingobium sp.]|uniref:phospholipase D-like domain-containing protein n=1 Tax=Novosphingobium sp. TaxID=1874826 RepID=UPI0031CF6C02
MSDASFAEGDVAEALFTLKIHRGDGMCLLAMNWRDGQPSEDFVGFAIEYQEPGRQQFFAVKNRLNFEGEAGSTSAPLRPQTYSTLVAPIQKFRWVHFPFNADLAGDYTYRVTPVFMNATGDLTYGTAQIAALPLARETYPGKLNIAYTRGFISSQAFLDRYARNGAIETLLPSDAKNGLDFVPTHPDAQSAYAWMGFEAYAEMLAILDAAIAETKAGQAPDIGIIAFDFNLPMIMDRVKQLPTDRLRIIIDNSKDHTGEGAAEDKAEQILTGLGYAVKRQAMKSLQHNKIIWVSGPTIQRAICGSTNMSWRGLFVQSNNLVTVEGEAPLAVFKAAFEQYWSAPDTFPTSPSTDWLDLGLEGIDAHISFSPHAAANSRLAGIGADIDDATSSIFYSLAFLSQTPGVIVEALRAKTSQQDLFVAGISDKKTGIEVASTSSNQPLTYVEALGKDAPPPFSTEFTGLAGNVGTRMHHKFIVLDFNTDKALVYTGSYNMSKAADGSNGENLLLIRDRRVATSYVIEALAMIDHYQFRVAQKVSKGAVRPLSLKRPPKDGEEAWFAEDWAQPHKVRDRLLFA